MNEKIFSLKLFIKLGLLTLFAELAKQGCNYYIIYHYSIFNWVFGLLFGVLFTVSTCKLFPGMKRYMTGCPLLILIWIYASNLFLFFVNLLRSYDISFPLIFGINFDPIGILSDKSTFLDLWVLPFAVFLLSILISKFFIKDDRKEGEAISNYALKISFLGIILGAGELYPVSGILNANFAYGDTILPLVLIFAIIFTIASWKIFPDLKSYYVYIPLCYSVKYFIYNAYDALSILVSDGIQKLNYVCYWLLQSVIIAIIIFAVSTFISMFLLRYQRKQRAA
jgi:hypothetical protein